MNRILSCFGCGNQQQAHQLVPNEEERSLAEIDTRANDLSSRILSNDPKYNLLKNEYKLVMDNPELLAKASAAPFIELLTKIEALDQLHKAQQVEKKNLKKEFHHWVAKNLTQEGAQMRQVGEIEKLIEADDELLTIDPDLPQIRFSLSAFFCNLTCCSLEGRVEQLKYVVKKEIY